MGSLNYVDWITEGKRVLIDLSRGEFTHKGIANRIGMAPGTLRSRSETLIELHECFKFTSSHMRWAKYHIDEVNEVFQKVQTGEQAVKLLNKEFGLRLSSPSHKLLLEGTGYYIARDHGAYIRRGFEIENDIWSYLVGYFIGDGSFHGNYVSWYTTKEGYLDRFKDLIPNTEYRLYREGYFKELILLDREYKQKMHSYGIPERKTYEDYELIGTESLNKIEFLAGWVDADGWIADRGTRFCITTSSKKLANQVVYLLGNDAKLRCEKQERHCIMQNIALSKRLSYIISRNSKYLKKRLDENEFKDKQNKIRKKNWDTRDCLRYISTGDGVFLCEWGSNT
jgi:hypothetical protein